MVTEVRYTSIQRVLDNLLDHPLLSDVTLEQAVRHALRFIGMHGYAKLYQDKIETIDIHDFRGLLPCDLIEIIQVKDVDTHICLRAMTDNFTPGMREHPTPPSHPDYLDNIRQMKDIYIPHMKYGVNELTFKTQGRIIYTSYPEGKVEIAYKSIPVDENGYPLLIDNEVYLNALEAYIKMKVFTTKFDTGKIASNVLQNAQQDYAVAARLVRSEFTTPSVSEMEAISRYVTATIKSVKHFDNGFKNLGDRNYIRRH